MHFFKKKIDLIKDCTEINQEPEVTSASADNI